MANKLLYFQFDNDEDGLIPVGRRQFGEFILERQVIGNNYIPKFFKLWSVPNLIYIL